MPVEVVTSIIAVGGIVAGAALAWMGDYFQDRRTRWHEELAARRTRDREVFERRWTASVALLDRANNVYAMSRDLATSTDAGQSAALRERLLEARAVVTSSLSGAFLVTPDQETRASFARIIRACRDLADAALAPASSPPTLASMEQALTEHREAIKAGEALLRVGLGVEPAHRPDR